MAAQKKTKKKQPEPEQYSFAEWVSEWMWSLTGGIADNGRAVAAAGVGLVALVGLLIGAGALESRAAVILATPDPFIEIDWPRAPGAGSSWLPQQRQTELRARASEAARKHTGAFSPAQLQAVGLALETSGWFATPPVVRRLDKGVIGVSGDWRLPAAVVRSGGRDHLVAWDGARLPIEYAEGESGLPVILNAPTPAPTLLTKSGSSIPDWKTPWPGDSVGPALALLRLLRVEKFGEQVAGIDVADTRARGGLAIQTRGGAVVIWGAAPGEFRPGEAPSDEKLRRLKMLQREFGSIDGGRRAIDIAGAQPVEFGGESTEDGAGQ